MLLKNTNPLGAVDLPLIGRSLKPGEEFEVANEQGKRLLEQVGNYKQVGNSTTRKRTAKKATPKAAPAEAPTEESK